MAQFEPDGNVDLIEGINWHNDYVDVRLFDSLEEQTAWFSAKPKLSFTNCSYTRQTEQFVNVDENIENLWKYSYLRFQNVNMGTKWFYAFITRLEYRAPSTTRVYFEIDVFQTWMFDFSFLQCLVERETVPAVRGDKFFTAEGLDFGTNYEVVASQTVDLVGLESQSGGSYVLITSTIDLSVDFGSYENPNIESATGVRINNLPGGCNFYKLNLDQVPEFFGALKGYPWVSNGIIGLTIIPDYMLATVPVTTIELGGSSGILIQQLNSGNNVISSTGVYTGNIFSNFPEVMHPKLLMFPYSFIEISCQNGTSLIVKPQYLNNQSLTIYRRSVVGMSPEIKYYLDGYCGDGDMYDYSLTINDLPQLPVLNTSYLLSVSQTLASANMSKVGGFVTGSIGYMGGLVSGAAGAGFAGLLNSLLGNTGNYVYNTLSSAQQAEQASAAAEAQSPTLQTQAGGSGFNYATGEMGVVIRWKMVSSEYRAIIGEFFNKYGVKTTRVKTPNIRQMTRFDYLKTIGCKLSAAMPNDDEEIIVQACNNGITFWHDNNIGNYDNNQGV